MHGLMFPEKVGLIKLIMESDMFDTDKYAVQAWMRWLYVVKAIICILVGREPNDWKTFYERKIDMAIIRSGKNEIPEEPTEYWWEALAVGHGLFKNWWYVIYLDGT